MKRIGKGMIKMMATTMLMVAGLITCSGTAFGETVALNGTTTGTFPVGVTKLTFTGQTFSWATDANGNATVKLGTLTNNKASVTHVDNALSVEVTFSDMVCTPATKVFTADIWASWNGFNGFCDIWFDEVNPTHFTYSTPAGTGSFDLGIGGRLSTGYSWENWTQHRWFGAGVTGSVDIMGVITNATFVPNRIAGDANNDGMVDVGDLGILAANYGMTSGAIWGQGDFNGDGIVDVGDLGILAVNYGQGTVNATVDFNADYAKAFGTTVIQEGSEEATVNNINSLACSGAGLPLVILSMFAGMMLVKLEDRK